MSLLILIFYEKSCVDVLSIDAWSCPISFALTNFLVILVCTHCFFLINGVVLYWFLFHTCFSNFTFRIERLRHEDELKNRSTRKGQGADQKRVCYSAFYILPGFIFFSYFFVYRLLDIYISLCNIPSLHIVICTCIYTDPRPPKNICCYS